MNISQSDHTLLFLSSPTREEINETNEDEWSNENERLL